MLTVHKFQFEIKDYFDLLLPDNAKIVLVELQGEIPTIWAIVNLVNKTIRRRFRVFGTGHEIAARLTGAKLNHVASFQQPPFVWHLFEEV